MMLFVVATALLALGQSNAVNVATSYSVIHHETPSARVLHKPSATVYHPSSHIVHSNAPHFA